MTGTADAHGSHLDAQSAGALAPRLMRAHLTTPRMSDWTSGANHWLLDVIAPDPRSAATVITRFSHLVPDGRMKMHPGILRLLDAETLKRWTPSKQLAAVTRHRQA